MPTTNIVTNIDRLTLPIYQILQDGRFNPYYKESIACGFGSNMFSSFMDMWADEDYICMPSWKRIEEQNDCKLLTVNASTINPTGSVALTISDPYKISGTYTNVQPGFLVGVPPLGKTAYVVSVNKTTPSAFTMVVKPYDADFTAHLAAGSKLWVIPVNARNEGDCNIGNSSSSVPGLERSYDMGIFSRRFKVTRTAAQSFCQQMFIYKQIVNYDGSCETVDTLWSNDLQNTYEEFYYGREILRLFGDAVTNTNVSIERSMTGLIPQLRAKARNLDYSASEGYVLDDIDDFTMAIKSVRGYCNEYFAYGGKNWRHDIDAALTPDFTNGAIAYGAFEGLFDYNSAPGSIDGSGGGKQRAISYGFTSVQKNGVTLHLHDLDAFNDECLGGAAGFNYPNTFFGLPACKIQCGRDGMRKPVELTFLGENGTGTNSNMIVRDFGILRENTYIGCDDHTFDILEESGVEGKCMDRWIFGEAI